MSRCGPCWFVLLGLVIPAGLLCAGQTAQLSGYVTDSQAAAVQGASVRAVNQESALERRTTTNSNGFYSIPFLLPGVYQIYVQAQGFGTTASSPLQVDVGQALGYNVQLKIGTVADAIQVTSAPSLMQTDEASVGQVMSPTAIDQTPLNGRNWVYIAQLAPGVAPPEGTRGAGKGDFNANGQRAEQNNFILDGVDDNSSVVDFLNGSSFVVRPPPDALAEFRVQTCDYSAEFGHSAGAVVNASLKSGTNQLHGSVWEYFRNTALDARDWENPSVPNYHENQFGATLALPLIRNKLFFFGDLEANRILFQETSALTVPTRLMREGNFSELLNGNFNGTGQPLNLSEAGNPAAPMGSTCGNPQNVMCANEMDPVALKLLNLYPLPNVNTDVFANNYQANRNARDNTFQFDTRMDWNVSSKDQAFARFSLLNEPSDRPAPLGPILDGGNFLTFGDDGAISDLGQNFALSETHVLSTTLVNQFRFGYNWGHFSFHQENMQNTGLAQSLGLGGIPGGPNNGGLPTVNIGGISGFGSPEFYLADEHQNVIQILDSLSKTAGTHNLKVGLDFEHIRFATEQPPIARGEYDFYSSAAYCPDSITYTGFGVSDFLSNSMGCAEISNTSTTDDARWERSVYVQDDWKLTSRITLNLGLRYEYPQTYRELYGRQAEWFPTSTLAPGNTASEYLLPVQSQGDTLGAAFESLLSANHVALKYGRNPYLVMQGRKNFAPRVGVAYRVSNRATVRAGYGVFYGGLESIGYTPNLGQNVPFVFESSFVANVHNGCVPGDCPTDGITLENGFNQAIAAGLLNGIVDPSLRGVDPQVKIPYTDDYNLAIEYAFTNSMAATVAYVGSKGQHLMVLTNPNAPLALMRSGTDPALQRPLPGFGDAIFTSYEGISNYNSLQAKLERRIARGLNFLATYTWSHALDDAPTPLGSNGDNGYPNTNIQSVRQQYSNSPFDIRQRFTFNGNYQLPFGLGRHVGSRAAIVNALVGGWSTSLTFVAQTGNPFSVVPNLSSETYAEPSGASNVYATLVGDPFHSGGPPPASNPSITCPTSVRNKNNWYNPCAFGNPLSGTTIMTPVSGRAALIYLGGRRDAVYGPGYERINMSWFKDFTLHEGKRIEFRADIFNLLNTPSYANPNSNSAGGGLQSGVNNNSSAGGQITLPRFFQNFTPDARFFQLALKLAF